MSRSRWHLFLFLPVVGLMFRVTWCYDPCPEYLRGSAAARPCNIPESEVEKAFKEAKVKCEEQLEMEKQQVRQGKVVNKRIKSAESVHPQANSPPRIREMEMRQCSFSYASRSLSQKYNLTEEEMCCGLPKVKLEGPTAKSAVEQCTSNQTLQCDPNAKYRTADGTCNNLQNTTWGSAFSCVCHHLPPCYSGNEEFRVAMNGGPLPNARIISRTLHNSINCPTNYVNHMYMFYGQLLDHDLTLTSGSLTDDNQPIQCCAARPIHPQCAPVMVPQNDAFYSQYNVSCLNFVRSAICPTCRLAPRAQVNRVTSFIDASFVYGSSRNETNNLRNQSDPIFLRVQRSQYGDLLPPSGNPQDDACSRPQQNEICFEAGDDRVNQHAMLTALHTVWCRQHNYVARTLRYLNPQWDNEMVFQEARKIVGAQMQCITYKEYLPPTLGKERMDYFNLWLSGTYTTYNKNVQPTICKEFSTFAFRFGHTMINSRMYEDPPRAGHDHYFNMMFFEPFELYTGSMRYFLRGSTRSPAQCFDRHVVPDVTNFLYRIRGNQTGFDLPAFNIQRGRDHGLQPYIVYVEYCSDGKIIIQNFDDLWGYGLMSKENAAALQKVYSHVKDIDPFTGMILETYNPGSVIGPTSTCFVGMQFYNLKYGDRFYFEHGGLPCSFTAAQLNEIKKTTMSQIICDNENVTAMPRNAFLYNSSDNPMVSCVNITRPDLTAWKK